MIYHYPNRPPVITEPEIVFMRHSIPRHQIIDFIKSQQDRLSSLYRDDVNNSRTVMGGHSHSTFHRD